MSNKKIVAVDFDGTCVTHEYPDVGREVAGAVNVLKRLVKEDWHIILWTMRSDSPLKDAVEWFEEKDIPLWGVNTNPEQSSWTNSPKAYAQVYIDDAAFGCPLIRPDIGTRPFVDWLEIARMIWEPQVTPTSQLYPYIYNADTIDNYDGDTVTANIDRGHKEWTMEAKIRLAGLNAPEINSGTAKTKEKGREARDWLEQRVVGRQVKLRSVKDKGGDFRGKYGRYVFEIFVLDPVGWVSVNRELLALGHAVPSKEWQLL